MKITQELNIDTESLAVGLIAPKKRLFQLLFFPLKIQKILQTKRLPD